MSVEKSNLKLKEFLNLSLIILILRWLLKCLIFPVLSRQFWEILPHLYIPNSPVILAKCVRNLESFLRTWTFPPKVLFSLFQTPLLVK